MTAIELLAEILNAPLFYDPTPRNKKERKRKQNERELKESHTPEDFLLVPP